MFFSSKRNVVVSLTIVLPVKNFTFKVLLFVHPFFCFAVKQMSIRERNGPFIRASAAISFATSLMLIFVQHESTNEISVGPPPLAPVTLPPFAAHSPSHLLPPAQSSPPLPSPLAPLPHFPETFSLQSFPEIVSPPVSIAIVEPLSGD